MTKAFFILLPHGEKEGPATQSREDEGPRDAAMPSGIARARELRRAMTQAEHRLWRALRGRRLAGVKFRRQVPLGPYIADFLSKRHRLLIEVDGGQHGGPRDAARDRHLSGLGYRTLRLWNTDVMTNPEGVLETILAALKEQEALLGPGPVRPPHPPMANAMGPYLSPMGREAVRANACLHRRIDTPLPVEARNIRDEGQMP